MATVRPRPTSQYSTHPLDELLTLWERGQLTADQMIGALLLHVIEQHQRIQQLERAADMPPRA